MRLHPHGCCKAGRGFIEAATSVQFDALREVTGLRLSLQQQQSERKHGSTGAARRLALQEQLHQRARLSQQRGALHRFHGGRREALRFYPLDQRDGTICCRFCHTRSLHARADHAHLRGT